MKPKSDFDDVCRSLAKTNKMFEPPKPIENPVIKSSERSAEALEQLIKNQELERQSRIKAESTSKKWQIWTVIINILTLAAAIAGIIVK